MLMLIIVLAFAACENGSLSGSNSGNNDDNNVSGTSGDKIMGLSYIKKIDTSDYRGVKVTTYLLEHSYNEALGILTRQLDSPLREAGYNGDISSIISINPNGVIFQDFIDQYRLFKIGGQGVIWFAETAKEPIAGKIYGCPYSKKEAAESSTQYFIVIPFNEAKETITSILGEHKSSGVYLMNNNPFYSKSNYVLLEFCPGNTPLSDAVRLIEYKGKSTNIRIQGLSWLTNGNMGNMTN